MDILATQLEKSAAAFPRRDAMLVGDTRLTYAAVNTVNTVTNLCANLLRVRGIDRLGAARTESLRVAVRR